METLDALYDLFFPNLTLLDLEDWRFRNTQFTKFLGAHRNLEVLKLRSDLEEDLTNAFNPDEYTGDIRNFLPNLCDYEGNISFFRQFGQSGLRFIQERLERLSLEQGLYSGPEAVLDLFQLLSRQRDKSCHTKLKALNLDLFDWDEDSHGSAVVQDILQCLADWCSKEFLEEWGVYFPGFTEITSERIQELFSPFHNLRKLTINQFYLLSRKRQEDPLIEPKRLSRPKLEGLISKLPNLQSIIIFSLDQYWEYTISGRDSSNPKVFKLYDNDGVVDMGAHSDDELDI
jgi:hypothetical protein